MTTRQGIPFTGSAGPQAGSVVVQQVDLPRLTTFTDRAAHDDEPGKLGRPTTSRQRRLRRPR